MLKAMEREREMCVYYKYKHIYMCVCVCACVSIYLFSLHFLHFSYPKSCRGAASRRPCSPRWLRSPNRLPMD